ncbi:MAG TPA: hypothetical protein VG871_17975 [Vicinamibacterales bacterium]|jgi:hypothetical protein|nr:hypothetical protein [Vicinamibacterales bacterium]HVZ22969.1 hypothetical protein [Vicinamibacterales bacterium]
MIAALPLGVFIIIVLFFVAMAVLAIVAGVTARKRAALVKATPTSPIHGATDGYREFEGRIEAVHGPSVTAPLTGWPCAWYHATVERQQRYPGSNDDAGPDAWVIVHEWTSGAPMLLRDGAGVCVVNPSSAEVTPTDRSRWFGTTEQPTDRNPKKIGPTEALNPVFQVTSTGTYRYTEERLYAGDPLLALGEFRVHGADASDDEDDDAETDQTKPTRTLTDEEAQWEREDALFAAARHVTRATIARGSGKRPFILTTTSQEKHVEFSEKGGLAAIGVAIVPLAIALLLIWARFG